MRRLMSVATLVGLFQGDVERRLADDGRRRRPGRTALGVSMSPSRLGSVTGWPVIVQRGDGGKGRAQIDADQPLHEVLSREVSKSWIPDTP